MSVHSICPAQYQTAISASRVNFCLIVVGLFRSCVLFSCTQLAWVVVGSFLGIFSTQKYRYLTGG